ncbi:hypothetical protein HYV49_03130 [Candidatus Pacearchaeota archaeon]|nr:hypothetical protein [Candidatus Pacearchaeota archaeon]
MFDKIFNRFEQRIKEFENHVGKRIESEIDNAVRLIKGEIKQESLNVIENIDEQEKQWDCLISVTKENNKDLEKKIIDVDSSLKELKNNYESIMDKVDKAGELLLSYESFYESTLVELDEVFKFVEMLNKRPILSTDPDFANFSRAIQLMGGAISKYQSLSEKIIQNRKENEAKEEEREIEKGK